MNLTSGQDCILGYLNFAFKVVKFDEELLYKVKGFAVQSMLQTITHILKIISPCQMFCFYNWDELQYWIYYSYENLQNFQMR